MTRAHYPVVEATSSWVAKRLGALAPALSLPARHPFRAGPAFEARCTASLGSLQEAARDIARHLALDCEALVVAFRTLDVPAHIEREGARWFIEVDPRWRDDGPALGAILAHECCHILLDERRVTVFGTAVDEVHVDLAVMLSGLGALVLNGIVDRIETRGGRQFAVHRSFGYLRAPLMVRAYARVATARGWSPREATATLTTSGMRMAVRWSMGWLAVSGRRRLPFDGPEPRGGTATPLVAAPLPRTRLQDRLAQRFARLGALDQVIAIALVLFAVWMIARKL